MARVREFVERYERRLSAFAIICAFIIDSVTLERIDDTLTYSLLLLYLGVVGTGIVLINLYESGKLSRLSAEGYAWLFIAMQFCFGGLLGRFLIYYSRSGSLAVSWPFLLILFSLLIANEFAKQYYTRLYLQISLFFLCLFSFLIFFVPLLLGQMGDMIFVLSGVLSLGIIGLFLRFLAQLVPDRINPNRSTLVALVLGIFLLINGLYFSNSIPPLPLSLRDTGVYHSVVKSGDGYDVRGEKPEAFAFLKFHDTIHLAAGEPAYVYSAIFAPTHFGTSVVHNWQQYDELRKIWVTESTVSFPIVGGQNRGYRGYSLRSNIAEGLWRVNIETERGAVIGRVQFEVFRATSTPDLVSERL